MPIINSARFFVNPYLKSFGRDFGPTPQLKNQHKLGALPSYFKPAQVTNPKLLNSNAI
jgi:hypothetical protein